MSLTEKQKIAASEAFDRYKTSFGVGGIGPIKSDAGKRFLEGFEESMHAKLDRSCTHQHGFSAGLRYRKETKTEGVEV